MAFLPTGQVAGEEPHPNDFDKTSAFGARAPHRAGGRTASSGKRGSFAACRLFESVDDSPVGKPSQARDRKGGAHSVAKESFAPEIVVCLDAFARAKVEAHVGDLREALGP